jgi:hypothetical protein
MTPRVGIRTSVFGAIEVRNNTFKSNHGNIMPYHACLTFLPAAAAAAATTIITSFKNKSTTCIESIVHIKLI